MKKKSLPARIASTVGLLLVLAAASWILANRDDLAAFVPMPAGAYAKFLASALFVEGRTEEQARVWARLPLPVGTVTIDQAHKSVTVEAYFQKATARWVDERHGVVLE
jgi:hypothetical protein